MGMSINCFSISLCMYSHMQVQKAKQWCQMPENQFPSSVHQGEKQNPPVSSCSKNPIIHEALQCLELPEDPVQEDSRAFITLKTQTTTTQGKKCTQIL